MSGIALFGVTGRMGQCLIRALREGAQASPPSAWSLRGALASRASARLGQDAAAEGAPSGVIITADPAAALEGADVALEFSAPQAVAEHARACAAKRVALLVGTTGFDAAARRALEAASERIAVLIAPNTSVGVTVIAHLLGQAVRALGADYDVEISEAHHRDKRDAPSGTALALGEVVARARGVELASAAVFDRHGAHAPREPGSIGFAVVRAGDIVGEHTVTFAAAGERIELAHRAGDRMTFARGALKGALWLNGRTPGLYGMQNVLGL